MQTIDYKRIIAVLCYYTPEALKPRYEKEMRPYISVPERRADPVLDFWIEMI
jgi:hypothetical protein